jgi:Tol biopolymer transport system component
VTDHDDLDRRLARWFEADALGSAPAGRFRQAIEATRNRRPRTSLLAGLGSHWVEAGTVANAPIVSWRSIAIVVLLALVLAAGAVFVGSQQRALPAITLPASNGLIAYSSDGDILVGNAATGQTRAMVSGPAVDSQPLFSPDGTRIAFLRGEWLTADASIVVVRADGSDDRIIVPIGFPGRGLGAFAWTPDSASILVNHDVGTGPSGGLLSMFDASGHAAPRLLTPPLPAWPGGGHPQTRGGVAPMFRPPTGDQILSYEWDTGTLSVMDPDGTDVSELLGPSRTHSEIRVVESPAWSPDGSSVVFAAADEAYGGVRWQDWRVFVMNADGSEIRRLTREPDEVYAGLQVSEGLDARWSPDGTRIAFYRVSHDPGAGDWLLPQTAEITVVDVATGAERAIGRPDVVVGRDDPRPSWSWSPDGRSLLVLPRPGSRPLTIDVETGEATELPWEADSGPSWQRIAADR